MSQIRRQSIIASLIIFIGFIIGSINTLIFTNRYWFTEAQYGLTRSFFDFGQIIFAFTFLGITSVVYKFSPYYKAHITKEKNDLLAWTIVLTTVAFFLFTIAAIIGKDFFARKFIEKSPELVTYYFWLFPFAYFLLIYSVLESHLWSLHHSVFTSFLREMLLRIFHSILILLFIFKKISYFQFILLYVFTFAILAIAAFLFLVYKKEFYFTLKPSKVTRRFLKKMLTFSGFIYLGVVIVTVASLNDSITISNKIGQVGIGIFALMNYMCSLIQVPQKSVIAVTIPVLSSAWREKKIEVIKNIYTRSSINLLIAALILFGAIWLSFDDAIKVLGMKETFLTGKWLLFFLGLKAIIDMGTGINGQIIGTSNFWRFEFFTGIILLVLIVPLNLLLIQSMGLLGAGIANVIAYSIYNTIRIIFLWKKYKMQPFSKNTLLIILLAFGIYWIVYFLFENLSGWISIFFKSGLYTLIMIVCIGYFKLTPDFWPVVNTIKKRLHLFKK